MNAVTGEPGESSVAASGRCWSFADVEFDERSFELKVAGKPAPLERKSLDVLRLLLLRAGEVVLKDELLETVWPGRIVSESVLAKCVSRIREVTGASGDAIKTVHGLGYRLVAPVRVIASRRSPGATQLDLKEGDRPRQRPLWRLVRRLGAGGQGEVWLGEHEKTGERRVYKFALDAAGLAAIKREVTLYRVLRDTLGKRDDFAAVLDWNLEEAPYFIELEHAEQGNLESWLATDGAGATATLAERLEVIARIADALAAAHSVGVLHKDLKPSNVLISGDAALPAVKLTDFGSGGVMDLDKLDGLGITKLGFTRAGMDAQAAAGTALYLPPEVITGQPATVQGDVYALGIMLYQAVIGDFKQPLAAGWEHRIDDPLLREDIALAVAGEPTHRLADAAQLAQRLRSLDERRRQALVAAEEAGRRELERQAALARARDAELALERMRARRKGALTALAALVVGFALSLALYLEARRARHEAEAAAGTARAVAGFLSKDLFSVVGERPLRDLTVQELLESASANLNARDEQLPAVSAQLHAALGNAFFAVERFDFAEQHLRKALAAFSNNDAEISGPALAAAAQLLVIEKARIPELAVVLPRYEALLDRASRRLGEGHPDVLRLKEPYLIGRYLSGDWHEAAAGLAVLVEQQKAVGQRSSLSQHLGEILLNLGQFEAAIDVTRNSVARLDRDAAPPGPALAMAKAFLARALIEREGFSEAERALDEAEALARAWAVRGPSVYLLTIDTYRGLLRLRQGRSSEARAILERTLTALLELDWVKAMDALVEPRLWLAQAYAASGDAARAQRMMEDALSVSERQWGSRHPFTQGARISLADVVLPTNPRRARRILDTVDRQVLIGLAADHPYLGAIKRLEGLCALADKKPGEARTALDDAVRIFEARYGPKHAFSARVRAERAMVTGDIQ